MAPRIPLTGDVIKTSESLTDLAPPAYEKRYPYKGSTAEPRAVSDSVATAPVSMKPKRQVKASGGEQGVVSDSKATSPVSMPPKIRKA
jgi:hypothetical protein